MILVDQRPLDVSDALNDKNAKMHKFAREYDSTLTELKKTHANGYIRFKRPGYPKFTKGADNRGNEVDKMLEPTPPMRIPLQAYATIDDSGKHLWMCCLDAPKVLPNGLWDMGRKRAMSIKEDVLININEEPDLAFFLSRISPFVRKKQLRIVDPKADDATLGEAERELTERKYAIWNMLPDGDKLKIMARAYGLNSVDDKQPNAIRKELEQLLEVNDKLKRQNPAVKGTKEFLEEMRITDGVLLRAFVQKAIDDKTLTWSGDGRWRIGQKIVVQIPMTEITRKNDYLCNYLMAGNNTEKLQEFIKDLINKEYLATITDRKEWEWLAKIAGVSYVGKKTKEIEENTTNFFCPI